MSTIKIPLNSRKYPELHALIDEADYELVSQYRWRAHSAGSGLYYAIQGARDTNSMHRLIMSPPDNMQVDHINGDGLDNRRSNLRIATSSQNHANRKRLLRVKSSVYRGVTWHKAAGKWQAAIKANQAFHYLGVYESEEDAARAYDRAAMIYFGEFANTNFTTEPQP